MSFQSLSSRGGVGDGDGVRGMMSIDFSASVSMLAVVRFVKDRETLATKEETYLSNDS